MQLVATVRPAQDVDAAVSTLVTAAGMTAAEARMRLAPEPPALLARLPAGRAGPLTEALGRAGLVALAIDEDVPAEGDRLSARSFVLDDADAHFTARSGQTLTIGWAAVRLVLRGLRVARTTTEQTETTRRLSVGRAVLTGGLVMTRKTTSTRQAAREDSEQFVLVHGDGGERIILAEGTVEFSGLGPLLQPSRTANIGVIAQELRRRAPGAFHDDRLVRLGRRALPFVLGGRSSVDVLAEVLDRAVRAGLLGAPGSPAPGGR